jgi:hypothetical protein
MTSDFVRLTIAIGFHFYSQAMVGVVTSVCTIHPIIESPSVSWALQKQKEVFLAEIERATGPGGRRQEKSDPERVRKNISNAVTRAIEAVAQEHDRLGKHLKNSITSGPVVSFDPERDPNWLI